jgi:hypothetical protein
LGADSCAARGNAANIPRNIPNVVSLAIEGIVFIEATLFHFRFSVQKFSGQVAHFQGQNTKFGSAGPRRESQRLYAIAHSRIATQFGSRWRRRLPAQKPGGRYKTL